KTFAHDWIVTNTTQSLKCRLPYLWRTIRKAPPDSLLHFCIRNRSVGKRVHGFEPNLGHRVEKSQQKVAPHGRIRMRQTAQRMRCGLTQEWIGALQKRAHDLSKLGVVGQLLR